MKVIEVTQGWTRAGVWSLEQLARLTGRRYVAEAQPVCCDLAYPNGPFCTYRSCPSGYTWREWACCYAAGHRVWLCAECTTGSSCWNGSFKCSYYYPSQWTC